MDVNQLMIPVYINEKIVLDMLAIIEDGFSTVSQVSYSDHKENSNAQKIEAEVSTSASILSKLLKIDLKGELSHSGNCGETEKHNQRKSTHECIFVIQIPSIPHRCEYPKIRIRHLKYENR